MHDASRTNNRLVSLEGFEKSTRHCEWQANIAVSAGSYFTAVSCHHAVGHNAPPPLITDARQRGTGTRRVHTVLTVHCVRNRNISPTSSRADIEHFGNLLLPNKRLMPGFHHSVAVLPLSFRRCRCRCLFRTSLPLPLRIFLSFTAVTEWHFLTQFYRTTEFYNGRTAKRQRKNGNGMVETRHNSQQKITTPLVTLSCLFNIIMVQGHRRAESC